MGAINITMFKQGERILGAINITMSKQGNMVGDWKL